MANTSHFSVWGVQCMLEKLDYKVKIDDVVALSQDRLDEVGDWAQHQLLFDGERGTHKPPNEPDFLWEKCQKREKPAKARKR